MHLITEPEGRSPNTTVYLSLPLRRLILQKQAKMWENTSIVVVRLGFLKKGQTAFGKGRAHIMSEGELGRHV